MERYILAHNQCPIGPYCKLKSGAFEIKFFIDLFDKPIDFLREKGTWTKEDIIRLYFGILPEFSHTHKETGKYLDQRM